MALLLVNVVDPYSGAVASPTFDVTQDPLAKLPAQHLVLTSNVHNTVTRDEYTVKLAPPPPPPAPSSDSGASSAWAPPVGNPNPGSAQAYAYSALQARGMGDDQFSCLVALWNRESHWNVYAYNGSSGAYGIPQAVPGSKMASAGADWQTNAVTQINWGLGYVIGRYGSPCGAWAHSENKGWY